jgi:hypothetical protein
MHTSSTVFPRANMPIFVSFTLVNTAEKSFEIVAMFKFWE